MPFVRSSVRGLRLVRAFDRRKYYLFPPLLVRFDRNVFDLPVDFTFEVRHVSGRQACGEAAILFTFFSSLSLMERI